MGQQGPTAPGAHDGRVGLVQPRAQSPRRPGSARRSPSSTTGGRGVEDDGPPRGRADAARSTAAHSTTVRSTLTHSACQPRGGVNAGRHLRRDPRMRRCASTNGQGGDQRSGSRSGRARPDAAVAWPGRIASRRIDEHDVGRAPGRPGGARAGPARWRRRTTTVRGGAVVAQKRRVAGSRSTAVTASPAARKARGVEARGRR